MRSEMNDGARGVDGEPCIALVDDNPFDNEYATIILRKAGYGGPVKTFVCGEDVLFALDAGALLADLILLDVNMPGMDGFEVASELSARAGGTSCPAIILLTSSSDPRESERAAQVPAIRQVLIKPLSVARASSILDTLLRPSGEGCRTPRAPAPVQQAGSS